MQQDYARRIAALAHSALMMEVKATPKPGLVDRRNNGAHRDMSVASFAASADAIAPYLGEMAAVGLEAHQKITITDISELRPIGLDAERAMYSATGGVNTHKGAIFSLGAICWAAGFAGIVPANAAVADEAPADAAFAGVTPAGVCQAAGALCASRVAVAPKAPATNGERAFAAHGARGARGEAEDGFPHALMARESILRYIGQGYPVNNSLCFALLDLMADTVDTNIISRGGMSALEYTRARAGELARTHKPDAAGMRAIMAFDDELIEKNISPGGSADMLAAGWLLIELFDLRRLGCSGGR